MNKISILSPPESLSGVYLLNKYLYDYWKSTGIDVELITEIDDKDIKDVVIVGDIILENLDKIKAKCRKIGFFGSYIIEDREYLNKFDFILGADILPECFTGKPFFKWFPNIPMDFNYNKQRKDSLFTGRLIPEKLNPDTIKLFQDSGLTLDLYGPKLGDHPLYNLNYKGEYSPEERPKIYSQYRFFILDSETDIFCLSAIEATLNGCIPIIRKRSNIKLPWVGEGIPTCKCREDILTWVKLLSKNTLAYRVIQENISREVSNYLHTISKPNITKLI
jgi:glycosyltransferase involved in cell wall biosynthesis